MEVKCLDSVFRIIKQYNYVELEAIHYIFKLVIEKSVDLEVFNKVERDSINACSALPLTVSDIFETFFRNNSISANKKYAKYYLDPRLSKYIVQKSNISPDDAVLDCNVLINGYLTNIPSNVTKRTGYQKEPHISAMVGKNGGVSLLEKELIYEKRDRNELKLYDKIFYQIPSDVHNITHASCAEYIKKLKIRGTSYEAVCLQMLSLLLNRKGTAYITISDAFLIRDTAQIVQTRKYLAEHFNIKEIIKIDDGFYPIKDIARCSILVLEEGNKTDIINFSTLTVDNSLKEMKYTSLDIIAKNNYKIIPQDTQEVKSCNDSRSMLDFNDIFEISTDKEEKTGKDLNGFNHLNCLYINKQGQATESKSESKYMISLKTGQHRFYLFYLKYIVDNTNVDYIDKIKLPGFNRTRFDFVQEYMQNREEYQSLTNRIYVIGKTLKNHVLNFFHTNNTGQKLSDICKISDQWHAMDVIAILFNTLNVGRAIYNPVNTQMKSHWWLTLLPNAPYELRYIYHYIGYYNERLQELSRTKSQNHLSQSNIQELVIPSLPISLQQKIIAECDKYEDCKSLSFDDDLLFNF
jgi:hypothetical protein